MTGHPWTMAGIPVWVEDRHGWRIGMGGHEHGARLMAGMQFGQPTLSHKQSQGVSNKGRVQHGGLSTRAFSPEHNGWRQSWARALTRGSSVDEGKKAEGRVHTVTLNTLEVVRHRSIYAQRGTWRPCNPAYRPTQFKPPCCNGPSDHDQQWTRGTANRWLT